MFKLSKSHNLNFLSIHKKSRHIYDDVPFIKNKRFRTKVFRFLRWFTIIAAILLVLGFIIFLTYLSDLKAFYSNVSSGKANIETAVELLLAEKYVEGKQMAGLAQENFQEAVEISEKYGDKFIIRNFSYLHLQAEDLKHLTLSAEILSRAIVDSATFAQSFETVLARKDRNFNQLAVEDKRKLLDIIYKSSPELQGIKANIDLSLLNLDSISYSGILFPFKQKVATIKTKVMKVQSTLEAIIPMTNFVPVVFGYPEKASYLFVLQNSDELRPTGGFIGTYGILETESGDILRFDTHDVYHLDMPVKDSFTRTPPAPLKKYLIDKWYLRDANWSPDWPTSARQIQEFFLAEDALLPPQNKINNFSGQFDGVIAITPELITDLLAYVGPVFVQGEEFNAGNFVDLLQYKVEQEYIKLGINSWHRKAVIGEIVKELKIKLFDLDPQSLYSVLDIFKSSLTEKDILLYFNDVGYQEIAQDRSWTGELMQPQGDYLMVVDANMASFKTDAVIKRGMSYGLAEEGDGRLLANLRLDYSHHGAYDWKTTRYQSYTRVYVPRGSQLISLEGAEAGTQEVYDEQGKTVFAFLLKIDPGKIGNIRLRYRLPRAIEENYQRGQYSIYVQKQPGKDIDDFHVSLTSNSEISAYEPTGFFAEKEKDNISWNTEFSADRQFSIRLEK